MQRDNQDRFEQILESNKRRLAALARSYASPNDFDDLYQEMLLQIWKSLDSFEGRAALDTWVYRVALNTALTHRRKTIERARHIDSPGELPEPQVTNSRNQAGPRRELQILDEFICTLNKVDRAVFLLFLEDFSYRQMSEITGFTENHIGVRISRIKKTYIEKHIGA
jgi:RNA polymerase sigma-70 factor (ECF subfamily)